MYVGVDLETSGLDPQEEIILEIGIIIYTNAFDKLTEISRTFHPGGYLRRWRDRSIFEARLDPFVLQMHTDNGLLDEIYESDLDLENEHDKVNEIIAFLRWNDATNQPMMGSTINFDRAFLKEHYPELEKMFHYRNIDVSTLKALANMYGDKEREKQYAPVSRKKHRVLEDIQDSIDYLEYFLNTYTPFMIPVEPM